VTTIVAGVALSACIPVPPTCGPQWIGPAAGDFAEPTNWSTGSVPGATQHACSSAGSSITVSDHEAIAVGTFEGSVTITATGQLSTVGGTTAIAHLEVQDGAIAGTGNVAALALDWKGGSLHGTGLVSVGTEPSTITGDVVLHGNRLLGIVGPTTWTGGTIRICDDSAVTIVSSGELEAANPAGEITSAACATVGDVAVSVRAGGTFTVAEDVVVSTPFLNLATTRVACGAELAAVSYVQPAEATTALTDVVCGGMLTVDDGEGTVQLDGGTLAGEGYVNASVTGSGAINPGDPQVTDSVGYLLILQDYTATAGATLPLEIAGEDLDDQDELYVGGEADISAATYAPRIVGGFVPAGGQTFSPLTAWVLTGTFATFTAPAGSDLGWTLEYSEFDVLLHTADLP
jgi:hypothetical protein